MEITDEMVERAKEALVSAKDNINEGRTESSLPHPEIILFPSEYEYLAEVVLTAALGDVEPVSDLVKLALSGRIDDIIGQVVNGHIGIGTATDMITGLFTTYAVANAKGGAA